MSANFTKLIPEMQPFARELYDAAGAAGLFPRLTSTLRTRAEQTRLYRRFVAGLAQYPVAPPGTSAHEFGYAFDMVVSPMEALPEVGRYWRQLGGLWGASDAVHFEYPGFRDDLLAGVAQVPGRSFTSLAGELVVTGTPLGEISTGAEIVKVFFPESETVSQIAELPQKLSDYTPPIAPSQIGGAVADYIRHLFTK